MTMTNKTHICTIDYNNNKYYAIEFEVIQYTAEKIRKHPYLTMSLWKRL